MLGRMSLSINQKCICVGLLVLYLLSAGCATRTSKRDDGIPGEAVDRPDEGYSYDVYYVRPGDTLRSIGQSEGVDWSRIADINDCASEDLSVGQTLLIPRHDGDKSVDDDDDDEDSAYRPDKKGGRFSNMSIVIDPGHGGKDPGAVSPTGLQEKDVNLNVAREVASQLSDRGVDVTLVRDDDTFVELNERAALANQKEADLFVSIHADSSKNSNAAGYTVYMRRGGSRKNRSLAEAVIEGMGATGMENRGVREADYRVLDRTRCPAILVELGFLSNRGEAKKLGDRNRQNEMAEYIVRGIEGFLRAQ